ncbi:appr-1-p processing enzyme family domain-containing protein [Chelonobacter oris]|uniref:Appr-1-p processing enzyme family domain-containing protein n=1 Tax=Chelonobacter oris TaxID=505317 RepID=A0A0A3AJV3_9PAST|nr:protein-ADP-ribose hydrolase [Chelonobacter oris]KGQ69648.1 appr-1-p processing enzyme family domain-containing protein [Chelonobacter oris]MDH3000305.1 appr-1-p processing enzyme family domain-containing protein [Chelonobacter oris]
MTRTAQLTYLIHYLAPDRVLPENDDEKRQLLRALMNIRRPQQEHPEFLCIQDQLLQEEVKVKGVVTMQDLSSIRPNLYLWQGDITRLQVGAIVNAANNQLLGCFQPLHRCIDNAIHSQAGLQLRQACAQIIRRQGHPEETGGAKITPAYNLPADYVLHTVAPIICGALMESDELLLASCYRTCLQLALQHGVTSVAFCCIGTGEFHFPNQRAAEIAIREVTAFLSVNPTMRVIFNVFKDRDLAIYQTLLS